MQHMIEKTPAWVWILLVVLVFYGINALKDRTVSLSRVAGPAVLFTFFSVFTVQEAFRLTGKVIGIWTVFWIVGVYAAIALFKTNPPEIVDSEKKLLLMKGTPRVLILCMLIFASRYALAYGIALDPELLTDTVPELVLLGITAASSGFFMGKLIACARLVRAA